MDATSVNPQEKKEQETVTPFEVSGSVNYDRLITNFGVDRINEQLLQRLEKVTGCKPHRLLRRGLFFAHRNLEIILDDYENGKPIFIYTGRGPSGQLHLGHLIPLEFTVWLQKVFNAIVVFQIADDEKYWFKDITKEELQRLIGETKDDIIKLGFIEDKTFIFCNNEYKNSVGYKQVVDDLLKYVSINTIKSMFGIDGNCSTGQLIWPIYQTAAAFAPSYPDWIQEDTNCLVVYAIDQDPYFRLAREISHKLGYLKPCAIISKFLPSLQGSGKMSTTENMVSITIHDSNNQVKKKINKYAFSGGKDTLEEHQKYGGNTDIDISFQYLKYFLESDEELATIKNLYENGSMSSGQMKAKCIEVINETIRKYN